VEQDPVDLEPIRLSVRPVAGQQDPSAMGDLPDVSLKDLPDELPGMGLEPVVLKSRAPVALPPRPTYQEPSPVAGDQRRKRPDIADNALDDFVNLAKELVQGVYHTGKIAVDYAKDPGQYLKDVRLLDRHGGEVMDVLKSSFTENYKDDEGNWAFWDAVSKRPAHTLADLTGILTLTGGAVAIGGKAVGGVSRLGLPAEVLAQLPKMRVVDRVIRVGEALSKAGNRLDPVLMAGRGVKAAAQKSGALGKIGDALGIGEHTGAWLSSKANEFASEEASLLQDKMDLAYKHLGPAEGDLLRKAIRRGSTEDFQALSPAAEQWYNRFAVKVEGQEGYLTTRRLGLTDERKLVANAKAAALENFGPDFTKEQLAEAIEKVKAKEWNPVYATLFEPTQEKGLIDTLTDDVERSRRYGRLEARTAHGNFEKDIFKVAMRQMELYHGVKSRIRLMDRFLQQLERKGAVKVLTSEADLKKYPGYAVVNTAILKRYFEVKNRAASALVAEVFPAGEVSPATIATALQKVLADPELRKPIGEGAMYAVPKHVARLIDLEFPDRVSAFGVVYDRLLNVWRSLATVWRPSAWVGAASGNAFMDLLHGVGPDSFARARALKNLLPPEIRSKVTGVIEEGMNPFEKVSQRLGDWYSALDEKMIRGPVFAKEAEEVRRRMKVALEQTGAKFFVAKETLDDPQRWAELLAVSPEKLSEAEQLLQLLHEEIAGSIPEVVQLRNNIGRLERAGAKLEAKLAALLEAHGAGTSTLRERQLRAKLAKLEAEGQALLAAGPGIQRDLDAAVKVARRGRAPLRQELERAIRRQEMSAVADLRQVLIDIREGGGIRPSAVEVPGLPGLVKKTGRRPADEVAQEFADRGIIADAAEDTLYEYLRYAVDAVAGVRAANDKIKAQARTLATTQVNGAIKAIIQNSKDQTRVRYALAAISKDARKGKKALDAISTERQAQIVGLEKAIDEAQRGAGLLENALKTKLADVTDKVRISSETRQRIPELERLAGWADEAISAGNRLGGAYQRLHPIERRFFRRGVPFYSYTKAMTLLAFRLPFLYPAKTFLWNRFSRMVMDITQDPETPEWMKNYLPVGVAADGSLFLVPLNSANPWGGVRTSEVGSVAIPSILDVHQQNPLLKAIWEIKGGTPEWTKRPTSPGERMVRIDSGEVYELTQDGRVRKTIAQPSVLRALWYLFPTSQLLETLLVPYGQTDKGWLFSPDPIRRPDGQPMYPVDLTGRVSKFLGVGVIKRDLGEEIRREKGRENRVMRAFGKSIRRAAPEERAEMREILRDWLEERNARRSGD